MYTPKELAEAERAYNEGARMWNSLPGPKLVWPEDKFKVVYCTCRSRKRTGEDKRGPFCFGCGYYIIGE